MERYQELLNSNRGCYAELISISQHLERLGNAFLVVGNRQVGEELHEIADDIFEAQKTLNGNAGEELNMRFHQAEQNTNNMLAGILAVSERTGK